MKSISGWLFICLLPFLVSNISFHSKFFTICVSFSPWSCVRRHIFQSIRRHHFRFGPNIRRPQMECSPFAVDPLAWHRRDFLVTHCHSALVHVNRYQARATLMVTHATPYVGISSCSQPQYKHPIAQRQWQSSAHAAPWPNRRNHQRAVGARESIAPVIVGRGECKRAKTLILAAS